MLASPQPHAALAYPTDLPYCSCFEQEWGEKLKISLPADDDQAMFMMDEEPPLGDKWPNPATRLPEPAPNLAGGIASQVPSYGEGFNTSWPNAQEYFEVPPPAPNIHSKPCNGQSPFVEWGDSCTDASTMVTYGETTVKSHCGKATKPRPFIPWKDVNFHGSHVRWKKGLDTTMSNHVAH